jgi:hypothetical protein
VWRKADTCAFGPIKKICEDYDGHVSRDMLILGFPTIFFRTKNQNSRIWIDWCKNINFQLPIAKVIGASTTLRFL